jgi:hypothetical protein
VGTTSTKEVIDASSPAENERVLAARQYSRYQQLAPSHKERIKHMDLQERFFRGDHWDASDVARLGDRPHMTVNLIAPVINTMLGEYIANETDWVCSAEDGATDELATVHTKLFRQIRKSNDYGAIEFDVYADGLIDDAGYIDVRVDFTDNIQGEVRYAAVPPWEVMLDDDGSDYDLNKHNDIMRVRRRSLDQISTEYGQDVADRLKVRGMAGTYDSWTDMAEWTSPPVFGDYSRAQLYGASDDVSDRTLKSMLVIERQWWTVATVKEFVDPQGGDTRRVPDNWDDPRVQQHMQQYGLTLREKRKPRIRWTVSCGDLIIKDGWSPYERFTLHAFFPYFRRGKNKGAVRDLINPNQIHNKVISQNLHIVNTTANSGWMVRKNTLANMSTQELAEKGSQSGVVIEYNETAPEKIEPNSVPSGILQLAQQSEAAINKISGVNQAQTGDVVSTNVSNVVLENQQGRGAVQLAPILENLNKTRLSIAQHTMQLVQSFYTDARTYRLTNPLEPTQPREEMGVNQPLPDGTLFNSLTIGEYGITIHNTPTRQSYNDSQFAKALEMRTAGIQIPDHWMIKYSDLDGKTELAQMVAQLAGFGDPDPNAEAMAALNMQLLEASVAQAGADVEETQAQAAERHAKAALLQATPHIEAAKLQTLTDKIATEQTTRMQVNRLSMLSKQLQEAQKRNAESEAPSEEAAEQRAADNHRQQMAMAQQRHSQQTRMAQDKHHLSMTQQQQKQQLATRALLARKNAGK